MGGTLDLNNYAKAPTISVYRGEGMQTICKIETIARSPINALSDDLNPTSDEIKLALTSISVKYGLDYQQLYVVNECESNFNNKAKGDFGKANGVAQFWYSTFAKNCAGLDYKSARDQLECQGKMWLMRQQNEWTCFKKFFKELKKFNYDNCILEI